MSILCPSFATTGNSSKFLKWHNSAEGIPMTVPRSVMFRPKFTSPETVRWSNSAMCGIFLNLFWNWAICENIKTSCREECKAHLFEVIAEFDDGDGVKDPCWVEYEMSVLERVNIALNEQEIGTTFHRQESTTRDIDTVTYDLGVSCDQLGHVQCRTFEMFDRCSCSRLQLRTGVSGISNRCPSKSAPE